VLALIAYTIAIYSEQKSQTVTRNVLFFLTTGILLDITATLFMIIGSTNTLFTLHGFLGYSALLAMLLDTILIWRTRLKNGINEPIPGTIHLYSRYAYIWWVVAFITGGLLYFIG
jgi:FtsH-binding integral membrane protein